MNPLYFIGAGPGSPDHLTLKGAHALSTCNSVFCVTPYEELFADRLEGKCVLVPFDFYYDELVTKINDLRAEGPVAFLIPGDLTFFAPFQALVDHFGDEAIVVPGVGIANAASARLGKTLELPGACNRAVLVSPRILDSSEGAPQLEDLAGEGATLIIYMNNIPLDDLVARLRRGYGTNVPIAILHRLDLPGEEVVTATLDDIVEKAGGRDFFHLEDKNSGPALTLVITGETLDATVDGRWWDERRDRCWRYRNAKG